MLDRLRPDFPDVTISKIRFLEAEGLISPERTPSGYRRFSIADCERLRYVLTAQRDQYLPLKVNQAGVMPISARASTDPACPAINIAGISKEPWGSSQPNKNSVWPMACRMLRGKIMAEVCAVIGAQNNVYRRQYYSEISNAVHRQGG